MINCENCDLNVNFTNTMKDTFRSQQETKQKSNTLIKKLLWFKQAISIDQAHSSTDDESMEQLDETKELNNNNEKSNQNDKAFYSMPEIHQFIEKYHSIFILLN